SGRRGVKRSRRAAQRNASGPGFGVDNEENFVQADVFLTGCRARREKAWTVPWPRKRGLSFHLVRGRMSTTSFAAVFRQEGSRAAPVRKCRCSRIRTRHETPRSLAIPVRFQTV